MLHRGTPLYGQPAWWGDGVSDEQRSKRPDEKSSERKQDKAETGIRYIMSSFINLMCCVCNFSCLLPDTKKGIDIPKSAEQPTSSQELSYFEIPAKDLPSAAKASGEPSSENAEASSSAEPVLGHASFTIEFDPGASGKVTVKDRVAKGGQETRSRPKRPVGEDLSPLQTAMVAAEVKVADWLAQNELPLALKETAAEEDGESAKSDVPVHLRSLQGLYLQLQTLGFGPLLS